MIRMIGAANAIVRFLTVLLLCESVSFPVTQGYTTSLPACKKGVSFAKIQSGSWKTQYKDDVRDPRMRFDGFIAKLDRDRGKTGRSVVWKRRGGQGG